MAVPKRRTSRTRRDQRRAHDAAVRPPHSVCPQCGAPKLPHRVCGACGSYRGREIVQTEDEV